MNSLSFVCKLQATLLAVCSRACPQTLAAADLTFYISQRKHVIYRQLSLQPRLVLLSVSKWEGSASQGQPSFPPSPPLPSLSSPPLPSPPPNTSSMVIYLPFLITGSCVCTWVPIPSTALSPRSSTPRRSCRLPPTWYRSST